MSEKDSLERLRNMSPFMYWVLYYLIGTTIEEAYARLQATQWRKE